MAFYELPLVLRGHDDKVSPVVITTAFAFPTLSSVDTRSLLGENGIFVEYPADNSHLAVGLAAVSHPWSSADQSSALAADSASSIALDIYFYLANM